MRLTFTDRLRELVAALATHRIPVRELGRLAGLYRGELDRLLHSQKEARASSAAALASLFGVPLEWLVSGEGKRPPLGRVRALVLSKVDAAASGRAARLHVGKTTGNAARSKMRARSVVAVEPAESTGL